MSERMDARALALIDETVRRWHKPFVAHAYKTLRDRPTAEDVVQQVWTEFLVALRRGDTIQNPHHFTVRILNRRLVDAIRRKYRNRTVSLSDPMGHPAYQNQDWTYETSLEHPGRAVPDQIVDAENRLVVRDALDSLSSHYRLAVEARIYLGMDMREAGDLAAASGHVKPGANIRKTHENHYYRALATLRERLRSEFAAAGSMRGG